MTCGYAINRLAVTYNSLTMYFCKPQHQYHIIFDKLSRNCVHCNATLQKKICSSQLTFIVLVKVKTCQWLHLQWLCEVDFYTWHTSYNHTQYSACEENVSYLLTRFFVLCKVRILWQVYCLVQCQRKADKHNLDTSTYTVQKSSWIVVHSGIGSYIKRNFFLRATNFILYTIQYNNYSKEIL